MINYIQYILVIYCCIFNHIFCGFQYQKINAHLVNKEVNRTINISTQLVQTYHSIVLENRGEVVVIGILFSIDSKLEHSLAYFAAQTLNSEFQLKSNLRVADTKVEGHENTLFKYIVLKDGLYPGQSVTITVEAVYIHRLVPLPLYITQAANQLVVFHDSHYFYSPYCTVKERTVVNLSSKNIEFYSKLEPVMQSEKVVIFGPYKDVLPFTVHEMIFHYENNEPFLTVRHIERVIEVSHWGNIAVREMLFVENTGATFKGPFSQHLVDKKTLNIAKPYIHSFLTFLPASATNVYYQDTLGNISTSKITFLRDNVELSLTLRFPLFGGWKTDYIIGYNVPTYEYLYNSGNDYILKMRLIEHIYNNMCVDNMIIKIILPEGCTNVWLYAPYQVNRLPDSLYCSYLDSSCRMVISLSKTNVIESHIENFELYYNFSQIVLLKKPLLVAAVFYIVWVTYAVLRRIDFSIEKD